MKATDVSKLRAALPGLEDEVAMPSAFQSFFQFAFRFCLTVRCSGTTLGSNRTTSQGELLEICV